ncbi:MAG TPA: YciI family protein [Terriglobales bacterium]|nr:YciI family protein [Terriglobales bacterium]
MIKIKTQPVYFVTYFETKYKSIEEIRAKTPDTLATHIARTNELHKQGVLLMAGAFRQNNPDEPISTMAIFPTRESAEEYAKGDPFVLNDMVSKWHIREWNNILKD